MNTAAGRARRLSSDTGASIASNRGRSGVSSASSCSNSSRLERHAGDQKASGHVFEEPRLRCFRSKDSASRTSLQAAASSSPGFKSESAPGTSPCQSPSPSAALCLCWRDSSARAAKLAFFRAMYLDSSTLERTPWTSPSSSSTPPTLQFKGGGCGTEDKSYATSTDAAGEYSILCGFGGRWPCRIGQASLCLAALAFQETGEILPTRGAHRDCHVKGERYCNSSRPVMSSHRSQTGHTCCDCCDMSWDGASGMFSWSCVWLSGVFCVSGTFCEPSTQEARQGRRSRDSTRDCGHVVRDDARRHAQLIS